MAGKRFRNVTIRLTEEDFYRLRFVAQHGYEGFSGRAVRGLVRVFYDSLVNAAKTPSAPTAGSGRAR